MCQPFSFQKMMQSKEKKKKKKLKAVAIDAQGGLDLYVN